MNLLYSKPAIAAKRMVLNLLAHDAVSGVIRKLYKNRIPHYSKFIYTDYPVITNKMVGYLFFKTYESSEVRFINQYLDTGYPVVELGSSIGVISLEIAFKTSQPVYCVEANPKLIPIIENNLAQNKVTHCKVFNNIIANSSQTFYCIPWGDDHTFGRIDTVPCDGAVEIPATSVSDFLNRNGIEKYVLVCDIEGAEIYILKEDPQALSQCMQIIIEVHDVYYHKQLYLIDELVGMIETLGFRLQSRYLANMVFSR